MGNTDVISTTCESHTSRGINNLLIRELVYVVEISISVIDVDYDPVKNVTFCNTNFFIHLLTR